MRPEEVVNSTAGAGMDLATGRSIAGGLAEPRMTGTGWEGFFCGKRGVVFALAGEPVRGGAEGFGGGWGVMFEETFEALGMGLVTAVAQAGGTFELGAGSIWPEVVIGSVDAAETFGRVVDAIFADAGLRGRGGRLMRRVSRLGIFGSDPSGVTESAIIIVFIVISENVQWRNSQSQRIYEVIRVLASPAAHCIEPAGSRKFPLLVRLQDDDLRCESGDHQIACIEFFSTPHTAGFTGSPRCNPRSDPGAFHRHHANAVIREAIQ